MQQSSIDTTGIPALNRVPDDALISTFSNSHLCKLTIIL